MEKQLSEMLAVADLCHKLRLEGKNDIDRVCEEFDLKTTAELIKFLEKLIKLGLQKNCIQTC